VTSTKQEEAGIYTLDKKVLLFLGPLAFRKKKGKINLIDGSGTVFEKLRHKNIFFYKAFFCQSKFLWYGSAANYRIRYPKDRVLDPFHARPHRILAMSDYKKYVVYIC
jgi:hypothetical protein